MTRDQIIAAIARWEMEFDEAMLIAGSNDAGQGSASWFDHGANRAARASSILAELRQRLAIIDGKELV